MAFSMTAAAVTPRAILEIEGLRDSDGANDWRFDQTQSLQSHISNLRLQVISPQTAYLLTNILADDVARSASFGTNSVLSLPFAAAVKTGTTTDWRDNWTLGYSTERVVGVWVGNADNTPMLDVSGIDGAGPIWHDLMRAAHTEAPPAFARPDGLADVQICAPSGMLATRRSARAHAWSTFAPAASPPSLTRSFSV